MKVIVIIIAFVVLVSGIVFSKLHNSDVVRENQEKVLSENSEAAPVIKNQDKENKDTDKNTSSYVQKPTNSPIPQATSQPMPQFTQEINAGFNLNSFLYPGSEIINSDTNSLTLKSTESPDKITDWYKEKIVSEDMNVKSFVTTKANDKVLNKLVGAKSNMEIRVEIKKDATMSFTEVLITLSNS